MSARRFAKSGYKSAAKTIGKNSVEIDGGKAVFGVLNAVQYRRQDRDTGFTPETTFAAVFDAAEFKKAYPLEAKDYLGKKAKALDQTFRVNAIDIGQAFVKVMLETIQKG